MNPWKDLVLVTRTILDEALGQDKDPLPMRVLKLSQKLEIVQRELIITSQSLTTMTQERDTLLGRIREPAPPPPDFNAAVIADRRRQRREERLKKS